MSIIYNTRYGATINGKHTFADYGLLPTSPPVIEPPEPKLYTVEIPGMNGVLDLSEALTGDVRFGMRTGIFTYQIYGTRSTWRQVYRTLLEDIHGQSCTVVLDEEPDVTYTGRVQITAFEPDGKAGKCIISLEGSFYPWPTETEYNGEWDTFNFETGTASAVTITSNQISNGVIYAGADGQKSLYFMSGSFTVFKSENVSAPGIGVKIDGETDYHMITERGAEYVFYPFDTTDRTVTLTEKNFGASNANLVIYRRIYSDASA